MITPNSPVSFLDARNIPRFGIAVSGVVDSTGPWPHVIVRHIARDGTESVAKVPARDVEAMPSGDQIRARGNARRSPSKVARPMSEQTKALLAARRRRSGGPIDVVKSR
jgi:hypothetical protein